MNDPPALLHGVRPAQAGLVLLGRPTCGQIAGTLVDLALRDVLRVEQLSNGASADWLLTLHGQPADLVAYEEVLLKTLFGHGDRLWFATFNCTHTDRMHHVASALRQDAVRSGWRSRWRKGALTRRGERLRTEIKAFRRTLRDDGLPADTESLRRQLPYAVVFGLITRPEQVPPLFHTLVTFALTWNSNCENMPGWRTPLGTLEPSSSYSEHHAPMPPMGGGDLGGIWGGV
ncbi:DUF2207 domain-containing protein [Flindersiella endophytica]